jgi:UDP-N-acetylglucosamine 2-epimerase (non-hydrolysing)
VVTDAISTYLFTPTPEADENLKEEGIPRERIFRVGDVMVDALFFSMKKVEKGLLTSIEQQMLIKKTSYQTYSKHVRPYQRDSPLSFRYILAQKNVSIPFRSNNLLKMHLLVRLEFMGLKPVGI